MGTSRNFSITGDIHGKVGPVVFSKWKGLNVVRAAPMPPGKLKTTKKQKKQRSAFRSVQKFVASMPLELIRLGYQLPRKAKQTAPNAAFSYHRLHALLGEDAPFEVDLTKVKFTQPINLTASAWNLKLSLPTPEQALISWELNPFPQQHTQPDDLAFVIFYEKTVQRFFTEQVRRDELSFSFSYPADKKPYSDRNMYCWIFFSSADFKKVSNTKYLGNFML